MKSKKHIKSFDEAIESLNIPDINDNKISKLINRKLNGEILSEKDILQLHTWMMENDKEYSNLVDKQLKKELKRLVPKGSIIK
jgi:glucuronate isomerase